MTITGINTQGVYCPDMGDVVISGLSTDDIIVEFTIIFNGVTKSTSWTERYTPLENEVRITNLGDVAFDFFSPYPFELSYGAREVGTTFFYYLPF